MWSDSLSLIVASLFILLGLVGVFVPLLPGPLLIWLTIFIYGLAKGFGTIGIGSFYFITVIALIAGTADIWMSLLGAKVGGAGSHSILYGMGASIVGLVFFSLIGAVIGYALGILYGEYRERRNFQAALKAGVGGVAGWGLVTFVELVGSLMMTVIFYWQVLGNR